MKLNILQKFKAWLLALGLTNKCPICSNKVISAYNRNKCKECGFGLIKI